MGDEKSAVTIFLFCFGGDMIGEEDKDQNSGNPRKKEASKDQKRDRRLTSLKKNTDQIKKCLINCGFCFSEYSSCVQ